MSSQLEANRAIVADRWPDLCDRLNEVPGTSESIKITAAKTGEPTATYVGQLLHSRFDPVREADRLMESSGPEDARAIVIFGFGLGYHVESAIRRYPDQSVLVIEPDLGLFAAALEARPLASLLAHRHLRLYVSDDPTNVGVATEGLSLEDPTVIPLRPAVLANPRYFQIIRRQLMGLMDRSRVNVNTLDRFGDLWVRNLLTNLEVFHSSPGIATLESVYTGKPALVVASGPSLDETLPNIAELAQRMVVIAVDTSLATLLDHGVEPDFTVVIDPQYWNSRHLDRVPAGRGVVVSEASTHPRALRLVARPRRFMSSLFPLGQYLESLGPPRGKLGTGGSVATTAWDLARVLGCRPIVMAGLDLGYPSRATHFRGAFFETRFHQFSDRIQPSELLSFMYLYGADPHLVPANSGGQVLTDRRMAIYAAWFATQSKLHPTVETLTLSRDGVRIEGVTPTELQPLLEFQSIRPRLDETLDQLEVPTVAADWSAVYDALIDLAKDLGRIDRLAGEAMSLASNPGENGLQRLNQIDRSIMGAESRQVVGFLMQPLIHRIAMEAERSAAVTNALERTAEVYEQIGRSARMHGDLIKSAVSRLDRLIQNQRDA